jgi:putative transposase
MKINLTYSIEPKLIPDFYYEILDYYGLSAKNIKNSTVFIIRNILSSYIYDKASDSYIVKDNLHSKQKEMLDYTNQAISIVNANLADKFKKKQDKESSINASNEKKPKVLKQFKFYTNIIDKDTYFQILDKSILEYTIKIKEKNSQYKDYTIAHSHLAQAVIHKVADDFNYYFKALKQYHSSPDNFTGRPKEPGYKSQNARVAFDISIDRFTNGGMIRVLKNHKLFTDYEKTKLISQNLIDEFNSFDLLAAINKDIENKGLSGKVVIVRVLPSKFNSKPKIEYVLTYEKELKGFYSELLDKSELEKDKDFFKLKDREKLNLIRDYFNNDYAKNNPNNPIPYFMGLDLGLVNFAAVSIYNRDRNLNYIISGRSLKKKIGKIDSKIDITKSGLVTDEISSIISKKDKDEQLTRVELTKLKEFYKETSINSKFAKYQMRKADITTDFLHKLSKALIQDCIAKEIKVIIVGKNKGWKQEINTGSKNNRAMYNFPHARFIEILKYKAILKDILVIEVEESYTSKTSFIDNEKLSEYNHVKTKTTQDTKNQLLGSRKNQIFITKNGVKLHADINGSFNIVRKVLKLFIYQKQMVSLSYNLVELNSRGKKKFTNFYKKPSLTT